MSNASGANLPDERPSSALLRLLPYVHRPPARVLLAHAALADARALEARGYAPLLVSTEVIGGDGGPRLPVLVAELDGSDFAGAFDLVCTRRGATHEAFFAAAARALRSGGQLFGAFAAPDVGTILHASAAYFDAARMEPAGDHVEAVFVKR